MEIDTTFFSKTAVQEDAHKSAFLQTVCHMGTYVQKSSAEMLAYKLRNDRAIAVGIKASIVSAMCIWRSNWGTHEVSRDRVELGEQDHRTGKKKWVYGNNLLLWESDQFWHGKIIDAGGKQYKSFQTWGDFGTHTTELFIWSRTYTSIMQMPSFGDQLKQVSLLEEDPDLAQQTLWRLIKTFQLERLDT